MNSTLYAGLRYQAFEAAAKVMGIAVQPLGVREPDDFEQAFAAMMREKPDAILMVADSLTTLNRKRVFDFARTANGLPAIYEFDFLVREGGLMSIRSTWTRGWVVWRPLSIEFSKGQSPADLPLEQPTRFSSPFISGPQRRSASQSQRRCSLAPTR
jgi:putative ABC transport system substrate-binding protein